MKRLWLGLGALTLLTAGAVAGETSSSTAPSRSTGTLIQGAGNGLGNKVSVSGSGTTVIQGSRWGVGNVIEVENEGASVRITDEGVTVNGVPMTATPNRFWSKRVWSKECGDYLYFSPKTKSWYRFDRADRAYYPLEVYPEE